MKNTLTGIFSGIRKIVIVILKILFCLILTLFVCTLCFYTFFSDKFTWQIAFYHILSVSTLAFTWIVFFIKTKKIQKIVYASMLIFWIFSPRFLPAVEKVFDKDSCLDSSICKEGLEINTEHGRLEINKENCLKYDWQWDDSKKWCNLKKQ